MERIFENIEEIRRINNVKQSVIAEQLGVTQSAYSNYVNRNEDIPYGRLTRIANILGVSVIDIITHPIKYVPESESCENCQQLRLEVKHLTEYIEILKQKKK